MPALSTAKGSSTPKQRQTLVALAHRRGLTHDDVRRSVGSRVSDLSAREASNWIKHFGGGQMKNAPGKAPKPYAKKRTSSTATRMIAPEHVEQIERLAEEYFNKRGNPALAAQQWLKKNFGVSEVRDLATADRAGQVIAVLKTMVERKGRRDAGTKGQRESPPSSSLRPSVP